MTKSDKKAQVVLLDHGLYVHLTPEHRVEYCQLWKAIVSLNMTALTDICSKWGIGDPKMFASMTLSKPYNAKTVLHVSNNNTSIQDFEATIGDRDRISKLFKDNSKIPKEMIFVSRNLNLVRHNNKVMGSPVNRPYIMAIWAAKGAGKDLQLNQLDYLKFRGVLFFMSISFYITRAWQVLNYKLFGKKTAGFEDMLDGMQAQGGFPSGFKIDPNAFDG